MGNVLFTEGDRAGTGTKQAGNRFQYRRFSCTVGTDQSNDLTRIYMKGNVLDGMDLSVIDIDIINLQHCYQPSFRPR